MAGDNTLFTGETAVEAAWTVVDPVLKKHGRAVSYKPGGWGPKKADLLMESGVGWHNPVVHAPGRRLGRDRY